jgi:hypothetical protein
MLRISVCVLLSHEFLTSVGVVTLLKRTRFVYSSIIFGVEANLNAFFNLCPVFNSYVIHSLVNTILEDTTHLASL